ncbi:hypothetical protein [Ralstonia sp. 24A2]|uniref:hypothetical protein n=1 Tax=Ralstonia sp. 24A2 TaxID=3447364 RepID=UPI003F6A48DC
MDLLARWLLGVGAVVAAIGVFIALYVGERRASQRYDHAIEDGDSNTADLS